MKRSMFAVVVFVFSIPAFALNNRSAVSVNGLDTNPCTPASPCRSFTAAIAQTNAGGEVIALDTAGYGPFTVTTSMVISGAPGIHAAITASGNAILVNASSTDVIEIRNLTLIGTGSFEGIIGQLQSDLRVMNCIVIGFSNGIEAAAGRLLVDHTVVSDGGTGIQVSNPSALVKGVITDSLIDHCSGGGVDFLNFASGFVANTTIVGISGFAVYVESIQGSGSTPAKAVVQGCNFAFNGGGILVSAVGSASNTAIVYLNDTTIGYSTTGVFINGAGQAKTYGNNRFPEVSTVGALSSIALQ